MSGPIERINVRLGVNDYEHQELEGAEIGTLFENRAYEGRIELTHAPWGEWDGDFGIQFGERQFSAIGEEAFIPPVDTMTVGLFLLEHREIDDWSLSLGGRLERQEHKPSSPLSMDFSGTAASASFAAIRQLSDDYALAMHFAVTERLPVAEELYADGPHLASSTFEVGDAGLTEETSRHMDIGFRKTAGPVTWTVTAFYTSFADFIFLQNTGMVDTDSELPIYMYRQQDAVVTGLEAELFAPVAEVGSGEIDLRIFGDYVDGELDSDGNLARLPPLRIGARVQYHDDRLTMGLESARYAKQDEIAPFEDPTPGYTMVNADVTWTRELSTGQELSVFFKGTNLLDEDARRHTSLIKDIAPLPGRNFSLGLRAAF
jgi:iron complex outermembrane receptor protein